MIVLTVIVIIVSVLVDLVLLSLLAIPLGVMLFFLLKGIICISPNEGVILTFCGKYKGTIKTNGMHWVNPLFSRCTISLKAHNF
mmetsp:Transcript_10648/g.1612  ORF Transcript_10648/g.1612 Transcript_10648/m.1612 type:complete len:84 (+) Transcript_10648:129-380(+)